MPAARPAESRVEALEVFVSLLSGLDAETRTRDFYDRLCEAVCRLTRLERAALFLYDQSVRRVRPLGFHGIDPRELSDIHDTLEDVPMAQWALADDRVVEVTEGIEHAVPARYVPLLGITTLTCIPLSAAGYWFGVIFADRGGGRFQLTDTERDTMWGVGKVAALAASAQIATREQERAHQLGERIEMAREIHERAMQRIFAVSLALGAEHDLSAEERARCRGEMQAALAELRTALGRPLAPRPPSTAITLREELDRLSRRYPGFEVEVSWAPDVQVPAELEPLAQAVLAEALRNAQRHARPNRVDVRVERVDGNLAMEVSNDAVRSRVETDGRKTRGVGLRLAALEALQHGGVLEFGPAAGDRWHVKLVVPLAGAGEHRGGSG
jgi:signal transduction histidine kinase